MPVTPAAPAAGATPPATAPTAPAMGTMAMPAAGQGPTQAVLAMDECGLKTKYPGDEYCIKAPDKDKGWQLHVGPTDYDNPEAEYMLMAGQEITNNFTVTTTNEKKMFFYYRQFRMRPGSHHNIITVSGGGGPAGGFDPAAGLDAAAGHRIGTTNHLAEDNPKGNMIAPENKGVGIPLEAKATVNVSLHSINVTDKPILREVWANFWYRPESEVTDPVEELYQLGDTSFEIAAHEEKTLGPYTCDIMGDGRMLWFYGHRHANNLSFSVSRVRGEKKDLFYLGYNWEEPLVAEYASNVVNTMPDPTRMIEGAWSGILDFKTGDKIEWECHVLNKTDGPIRFTNNTYTGEMCILDGELVGANCMSAARRPF
jgi:hypothetical protein